MLAHPFLRAVLSDQRSQLCILFAGPGALDGPRFAKHRPALRAHSHLQSVQSHSAARQFQGDEKSRVAQLNELQSQEVGTETTHCLTIRLAERAVWERVSGNLRPRLLAVASLERFPQPYIVRLVPASDHHRARRLDRVGLAKVPAATARHAHES